MDKVVSALQPWKDEFDAIAFRGVSGAMVAPTVAYLMGKHVLVVRKSDGNHSSFRVEGPVNLDRYVIVDDLLCTGNTINVIQMEVLRHNEKAKCVGVCLYNNDVHYGPTTDFFRENHNMKWVQTGTLHERARRFVEYIKWYIDVWPKKRKEMLFEEKDGRISCIDACFPREEEREAFKQTTVWLDLMERHQ